MTNKPTVALIGAPTDVGAGVRGVNLGLMLYALLTLIKPLNNMVLLSLTVAICKAQPIPISPCERLPSF